MVSLMLISFAQLEKITGGKNLSLHSNDLIATLAIDSRKVTGLQDVLFLAIEGERHDGHQYIHELYQKGVRQFVIERPVNNIHELEKANIIQVTSSIDALQKIAAHHRQEFSIPVIGITGSNGKTIIKEWLYQLISKDKIVVKNPGSYNSQVGVPLSVWQLQKHHQLAIFEAGVSQPGEMEKLARVIRPTIGIFSTIGSAHDEGFSNRQLKVQEKLKLFEHVELLISCADHSQIQEAVNAAKFKKTLTWGFTPGADIVITHDKNQYLIRHQQHHFTLQLPFADKASVENCFHCVAALISLGYSTETIQERVNMLRSIPMRLELKEGINQCQIIDDTYNNDLGGLEISLQFLLHQHQKKKKTLILSDILESGLAEKELAENIAVLVKKHSLHRFVGIGNSISRFQQLFPSHAIFYTSTQDFLKDFNADQFQQEIILVKGARTFQFEKIVGKLQRKVHGTIMEIDLSALVHNLNYFKSKLKPATKLMVMVKAFAYGSGSIEIANLLQYHKADYLGVAYADEGVELRKNNITLPIMVMNPSEESFDQLIHHNLEPEVYSFKILKSLLKYLEGRSCSIHLKLDTGMHRLGFERTDIPELIALLKANSNITVASIFSHLAGADEAEHDHFSRTQADNFLNWAQQISTPLGTKPLYHLLNSPGILRLTDLQLDMVRLGIGLYGVDPTSEGFQELKPVASLKTIISQIKHIEAGESIGYGRRGKASAAMRLATIAIGYADGFNRAFSRGAGEVLVNGSRAKVVGNVCMDMTMIDVTHMDAHEGDEVIVFGPGLPIQELASMINTIPYEILTNTSERVKRIFIAEGI